MKKAFNLKVMGVSLDNCAIYIDGKEIQPKKNKFGNLTYNETYEKDDIRLQIVRYVDVGGFFWFLFQIFLHIITLFGILDFWKVKYQKRIDFVTDIELAEGLNEIVLTYNGERARRRNRKRAQQGEEVDERAFKIDTASTYTELSNSFIEVEKEKTAFANLKVVKKWTTTVCLVVCAILIVVSFLI